MAAFFQMKHLDVHDEIKSLKAHASWNRNQIGRLRCKPRSGQLTHGFSSFPGTPHDSEPYMEHSCLSADGNISLKQEVRTRSWKKRELNLRSAFDFLFIFVPLAHIPFLYLGYLWGLNTSNEPTISFDLTSLQLVTELMGRTFFRLLFHDLGKQRPCRY